MVLVIGYLALAVVFYTVVALRAPVEERSTLVYAPQQTSCEVIEIFGQPADQAASRAA